MTSDDSDYRRGVRDGAQLTMQYLVSQLQPLAPHQLDFLAEMDWAARTLGLRPERVN